MDIQHPDDWARKFKLHHCIGNKNFAKQIRQIQREAYLAGQKDDEQKAKKVLKSLDNENWNSIIITMKPFQVIWLDDSNDLRVAEFDNENQAQAFLESKNCKAVTVFGNIASVDTAYAC